jgi:osmoprotectant transport system substrate-binding protein
MNTPEQFIIGQMYALALSAEGYSLSLTQNIGTTSVSDAALKQGSLDIFPEYLNIWDTEVAGAKGTFRSLAAADRFGASYAAKQGFELLPPTPFSDTDGIAVTSAVAALNHLRTIPNLQSVAYDLVFGAPLEFLQSGNGLKALEQIYHFQPAQTRTVDIGSQYTELTDGTVGAALVYTTDPQLSSDQYTLLRDPKHFFGFGNVVPVTTKAVLQKEGPVFVKTIESIDSLLTQQVMMTLNGEVELDGQAPIDVARAFLDEHGLLPGPSGS